MRWPLKTLKTKVWCFAAGVGSLTMLIKGRNNGDKVASVAFMIGVAAIVVVAIFETPRIEYITNASANPGHSKIKAH